MTQRRLTPRETQFLKEALSQPYRTSDIRLREGEYQHALARAIASFQIELRFPDVKDIIAVLYGPEKANDIQFVRKIQTILKKMEKSNVVRILPKKRPWELQRYTLSSLRFQDADGKTVDLATEQQVQTMQNLLQSTLSQEQTKRITPQSNRTRIPALLFGVGASYSIILWDLLQRTINPLIFVPAFSFAVGCSVILGKTLAYE